MVNLRIYKFVLISLFFLLFSQYSWGMGASAEMPLHPLNTPVAYCVSELNQCSADKEIAFSSTLPLDTRALNGGKSDPITLVYAIPELAGADPAAIGILVSPRMRKFCFQLDVNRATTQCANHKLTRLVVAPGAKRLYAQQVEGVDVRVFAPNMLMGTSQALEEKRLDERDPIMALTGWYILLAFAGAAQLLTRRNRWATVCLIALSLTLTLRTLVASVFGFAGFTVFDPETERILERLTIVCICFFAIQFYGALIGDKLKTVRRVYQALLLGVCIHAVLATSLEHVFYSIRAMQYMSIVALGVIGLHVYAAVKLFPLREKVVLLVGAISVTLGGLIDVYMALSGIPFFAGIGLFPYCFALESLCQFILIAMRNDAAHQEAMLANQNALLAQQQVMNAQSQAEVAKTQAEAQQAHNEALLAQSELTQAQLAQAEKMASLGELIAGVTHEINTPIGAIKSSGASITEALSDALSQLPPLLQSLDASSTHLFLQLILQANTPKTPVSSREERTIVKATTEKIDAAGIEQPRQKAVVLVNLNAHHQLETFLPLLQHPHTERILETASNVAIAISSAKNINLAVERVAKIVLALKSFSRFDQSAEKIDANLAEGIETVLTIYQAQTKHGIEIVRNYDDMPDLNCLPDELIQVWTNLIHNALQAMNHQGTLTLTVRKHGNEAVVSVGDSGCGIPEEIRSKIFDVFFTTKPAGVGSGLGLDIVKKIIDKHQGRIDVQSEVNVGTTFSVYLPYTVAPAANT